MLSLPPVYPSKLTSLFFQSYIPLFFSSVASADSPITDSSVWDSAATCFSLSLFFFCALGSSLLRCSPSFFFPLCICGSCSSLSSCRWLGGRGAFAVEIKVIKDLPWPPPVGQLNSTPTVVEELESPTQTAQAPAPGQTCCDQHHHGGCCAHIFL